MDNRMHFVVSSHDFNCPTLERSSAINSLSLSSLGFGYFPEKKIV